MLFRFIAYFTGPWVLLIFSLTMLSWREALTYFVVGALWTYLSWEDQQHLSVPSIFLYIIAAITAILGLGVISPSFEKIEIAACLIIALVFLKFYEALKRRLMLGGADVVAISTLAVHLTLNTIGIWLMLAGLLGILSYLKDDKHKSCKIPFLPYLSASWLIVISGSNLL